MDVAKNWNGEFVILRNGEPPMKLETLVAQLDHANLTINTLQAELAVTRTAYRILNESRNFIARHKEFVEQRHSIVCGERDSFKQKSDRRANIIRGLLRLISTKSPDAKMISRCMKIADEELVTG